MFINLFKSSRFLQVPPFDVDFFLKYIKIEQCFKKVSIQNISKCYDVALQHFGDNNIGLWLDYIKFCHYNRISNDNLSTMSDIYWRALKQLKQNSVEDFNQKFNLLKIQLDNGENRNMEVDDVD